MIRLALTMFGAVVAYAIAAPELHRAAALITQATDLIP